MKQMVKWIVFIALFFPNLALSDIAIIVHIDNPTASISPADLKSIYRARIPQFPDGRSIHLSYQPSTQKVTQEFLDLVIGRSMAKLNRIWAAQIFSGKMEPPAKLKDDSVVINWIAKNRNGIAYIDDKNLTDSVKKIATIKSVD